MGIFGAIGDIFGSVLGAKSAENAKDANVAMSQADRDLQKEFAQQGVRWRVDDAKAAGIHPLYALGANTPSASPTAIAVQGDDSWSRGLSNFGQNIDRAVASKQTSLERLQERMLEAQIKGQEIDNMARASNVARLTGSQMPPAMPSLNDVGAVQVDPSRRTSTARGFDSVEAAVSPANKLFRNLDGSISIWPSNDAKQSIEDSFYEFEHLYRNRIAPYFQRFGRSFGQAWEDFDKYR